MIFGVMIYIWYFSKTPKETTLAKQKDIYNKRGQTFQCDIEFLEDIKEYPTCVPNKCGRYVSDEVVTGREADTLLTLAQRGSSDYYREKIIPCIVISIEISVEQMQKI